MRELRFDETLTVRRPNRALVALASLPLVIACALLAAALVRLDGTAVMFVPHLLALGATALWTVLRQRPYARHTLEPLRVDASTLHLGDARVRLAEIPRALYLPVSASGHELVRVERRRRPAVELIVNDRAQAERLLAALGHAPGQRVATFRAHSRLATTPWRFAAIAAFVGVGVAHGVGLLPAPSIVALLVAGLGLFAAPTAVEVGADGVLLRWLGTRRFVPVANVQRVERFNEGFGNNRRVGVRLHLSGGLTEQLAFGLASSANDEVTAFEERVEAAINARGHGDLTGERAALTRNGRPVGEWVRALRALGGGAVSSFRRAGVERDRIWRVLASPEAAAEERAAAAVALTTDADPATRERVRVTVDAVADPKLRVAIDAATGDDDEALTRALTALDDARGEG